MTFETVSDGSVDAGLLMLEAIMPYGREMTQQEIAYVCGCSHNNIGAIERRALKKIEAEFRRRLDLGE